MMMDGRENGLTSGGHICCAFGLAHPLRVCTRLVRNGPTGQAWVGRGGGGVCDAGCDVGVAWSGEWRGVVVTRGEVGRV